MTSNFDLLQIKETQTGRSVDCLVDPTRFKEIDHNLSKRHNFDQSLYKRLVSSLSQDNVIIYGLIHGEEAIPMSQTTGKVHIPVIDADQIKNESSKISVRKQTKLRWIHISTIQIILKSTYDEGISSQISLRLTDERFTDPNNALIAEGKGDLKFGKIKFNLNYRVSMCLADANLENAVTLRYKLLDENLMRRGNHPFSITYRINYALSNSHHSLNFRASDKIEIDRLFKPLVQIEAPKRPLFRVTGAPAISRVRFNEDEESSSNIGSSESVEIQPFKQLERNGSLQSTIEDIARELNVL